MVDLCDRKSRSKLSGSIGLNLRAIVITPLLHYYCEPLGAHFTQYTSAQAPPLKNQTPFAIQCPQSPRLIVPARCQPLPRSPEGIWTATFTMVSPPVRCCFVVAAPIFGLIIVRALPCTATSRLAAATVLPSYFLPLGIVITPLLCHCFCYAVERAASIARTVIARDFVIIHLFAPPFRYDVCCF